MGVLSAEGGLELGLKAGLVAKECCTAAYLRGAFLGSGFVSDPRGDFHFEVTVESEDLAGGAGGAARPQGHPRARHAKRRSSLHGVPEKRQPPSWSSSRSPARTRARSSMENARVIKSVRNDVNRMTNAEIANQAKAASASVDQLYAIRVVLEAHGMENLPPALQEFITPARDLPRRHAQGAGRARDPAPVEVGRVPPRSPDRADGERVTPLEWFAYVLYYRLSFSEQEYLMKGDTHGNQSRH